MAAYRKIKKFPAYRVGSDGSVWSCKYGDWRRLKCAPDSSGYPMTTLFEKTRKWRVRVHVLVLTVFRGKCPRGMQCCHRNGKRNDCRVKNLRWDTPKGNSKDSGKHGTRCRGSRVGSAKLRERSIRKIRAMIDRGDTYRMIAEKFCVGSSSIRGIAIGRTWKSIPGKIVIRRVNSVLKERQARAIKRRLMKGESGSKLSREFNVSPMTISDIKRGATWKHI